MEVAVISVVVTCVFFMMFLPLYVNADEGNKMYLVLEKKEQTPLKINSVFCIINNDEKYTSITRSSLDEWSKKIKENTSIAWNYVLLVNQNYLSKCDVTIQFSEKPSLIENYDYFGMTTDVETKPMIKIFTTEFSTNKSKSSDESISRILKHEIGHSLHLGHSSNGSIMSLNHSDKNVTNGDAQNFALTYKNDIMIKPEKVAIYDLNSLDKNIGLFKIKKNDILTTRLVLSKTIPLEKASLEFGNVKISFDKGTAIKVNDVNHEIDNINTAVELRNSVNVLRINFTLLKTMSSSDIDINLDDVTGSSKNYKIVNAIQII
ncbi:MAG TPA: hypothetical protein VLD38_09030 [Nitrosopumilaceae archaeon]|nr:hypothetical protein [Nitrosopumilaceae archaeon]